MSASDLFVTPSEADWMPTEPGVKRRLLTYDDEMMVVEVAFERGAVGAPHSHPHRQASVVAEGVFEVMIEGRTERLSEGASFIVPSNAVHGCRAIEAGRLIDTFTPARAEFLA